MRAIALRLKVAAGGRAVKRVRSPYIASLVCSCSIYGLRRAGLFATVMSMDRVVTHTTSLSSRRCP